jgi:hypothetical protein
MIALAFVDGVGPRAYSLSAIDAGWLFVPVLVDVLRTMGGTVNVQEDRRCT